MAMPDVSSSVASRFLGSVIDGPGRGLIVLRGDIDAAAVELLGQHIEALFGHATRHLRIDAAAVDSYDTTLLELLGRTQRRLGAGRGVLWVTGLHPSLLPLAGADSDP